MRIVLDTNVIVAGLKSRNGASFQILSVIPDGRFTVQISVPLLLVYEDVFKRPGMLPHLDEQAIDDVLSYLCQVADRRSVFYTWRPQLRDPKDDMVLELAVAAQADYIVTFNTRDFAGSQAFGIDAITPGALLNTLRGES